MTNRSCLLVGGAVLLLLVLSTLLAPLIAPHHPLRQDLDRDLVAYSADHPFGTDKLGRDILSRILYGGRVSLTVGISTVALSLAIGFIAGSISGFFGGWIDQLLMRLVDIQLSVPSILVALMLLAMMGRGVNKIIFALVIVQWAYFARTARASALVERKKEYVEAAEGLGLSSFRILAVHLLPNCLPPLIVVATLQVAAAILLEATLSFLGIGLPPTQPSLGLLISNGFDYMMSGRYWISFFPGIALFIMIAALNLVGDQLRDIMNPRLKR